MQNEKVIFKDIRRFSLTMMLLGAFLSMWISNVISPTIIGIPIGSDISFFFFKLFL